MFPTEEILGIPVDLMSEDDIINQLPEYIQSNKKMTLTSINPQILLVAEKNEKVRNFLLNSTHRFPDGIGVVKLSKWTKGQIGNRIAGIDIMTKLLAYGNEHNNKFFLYGAAPDVVKKAVENITETYENLSVVGYIDGYSSLSDGEIINEINKSEAEILFVALGSPKQEEWLEKNMEQINCRVFQTVGGSFDVFSGYSKRAPDIWIKLNLEWVYRSFSNPKRIYRLFQIPLFVIKGLFWNIKHKKS